MIQSLGRLQIAIGVDRYPKVLPMWYITGAYNEWKYRWLVSNVPSDLFFCGELSSHSPQTPLHNTAGRAPRSSHAVVRAV